MKQNILFKKYLVECPVIAILRGITPQEIPSVCNALYEAGIRLLEIPLNSPSPFESISAASRHCNGKQLVGAGTVLTVCNVERVAESGGEFIISPNTDTDVISATVRKQLISIPGVMTPTECFTALSAGADYLKFFPAGSLGPGHIRDLKAVVKAPILAVGGIHGDNISDFLAVCPGVGIGRAIYKPGMKSDEIAEAAEKLLSRIRL